MSQRDDDLALLKRTLGALHVAIGRVVDADDEAVAWHELRAERLVHHLEAFESMLGRLDDFPMLTDKQRVYVQSVAEQLGETTYETLPKKPPTRST